MLSREALSFPFKVSLRLYRCQSGRRMERWRAGEPRGGRRRPTFELKTSVLTGRLRLLETKVLLFVLRKPNSRQRVQSTRTGGGATVWDRSVGSLGRRGHEERVFSIGSLPFKCVGKTHGGCCGRKWDRVRTGSGSSRSSWRLYSSEPTLN